MAELPELGSEVALDLFFTGHEEEHVAFGSRRLSPLSHSASVSGKKIFTEILGCSDGDLAAGFAMLLGCCQTASWSEEITSRLVECGCDFDNIRQRNVAFSVLNRIDVAAIHICVEG